MFKPGSKIDEVRVDGSLDAFREDLNYYGELNIEAVELPVHGLDAVENSQLDKKTHGKGQRGKRSNHIFIQP